MTEECITPCQKCQNVADLPAGYSNDDYFVQIVGVLHPGGQFLEEQGHVTLRAGGPSSKPVGCSFKRPAQPEN